MFEVGLFRVFGIRIEYNSLEDKLVITVKTLSEYNDINR